MALAAARADLVDDARVSSEYYSSYSTGKLRLGGVSSRNMNAVPSRLTQKSLSRPLA